MKFEPSDYLQDLNFELADTEYPLSYEEQPIDNGDLDLFSKTDFFNLDDFNLKRSPQYIDPALAENEAIKREIVETPVSAAQAGVGAVETGVATPSTGASTSPVDVDAGDYKRKRNTAASARFRIKKKLKEQQMEARSKELQEKVVSLEKKLMTLEMENKCLKNMIIKKNEESNVQLLDAIKKRSISDSKPLFEYTK